MRRLNATLPHLGHDPFYDPHFHRVSVPRLAAFPGGLPAGRRAVNARPTGLFNVVKFGPAAGAFGGECHGAFDAGGAITAALPSFVNFLVLSGFVGADFAEEHHEALPYGPLLRIVGLVVNREMSGDFVRCSGWCAPISMREEGRQLRLRVIWREQPDYGRLIALVLSIAEARHVTHAHHLKGLLHCGRCGSRMLLDFATNPSGTTYAYFVCSGRATKKIACTRRAAPVKVTERLVEDSYASITISDTDYRRLAAEVDAAFDRESQGKDQEFTDLTRRRAKLEAESDKLLAAHFADAIDAGHVEETSRPYTGRACRHHSTTR